MKVTKGHSDYSSRDLTLVLGALGPFLTDRLLRLDFGWGNLKTTRGPAPAECQWFKKGIEVGKVEGTARSGSSRIAVNTHLLTSITRPVHTRR